MSKRLSDPVSERKLSFTLGWIDVCPSCGAGLEKLYENPLAFNPGKLIGNHCRECKLLWNLSKQKGIISITGTHREPAEKERNYVIVVTHTDHCIKARTAEEARKKLIKQLRKQRKDKYVEYGTTVKHLMDDAEYNEGIC